MGSSLERAYKDLPPKSSAKQDSTQLCGATNLTYEQNQTIRLRCNRPRKSGEGSTGSERSKAWAPGEPPRPRRSLREARCPIGILQARFRSRKGQKQPAWFDT